jgi:hypothetical protein
MPNLRNPNGGIVQSRWSSNLASKMLSCKTFEQTRVCPIHLLLARLLRSGNVGRTASPVPTQPSYVARARMPGLSLGRRLS